MSEAVFMSAVRHLQTLDAQLQPELRNRLYGLYKQATEGDCAQEPPAR
jgi:acyl-CoA-binding protein